MVSRVAMRGSLAREVNSIAAALVRRADLTSLLCADGGPADLLAGLAGAIRDRPVPGRMNDICMDPVVSTKERGLNTTGWQSSAIPQFNSANGTGWEDTTSQPGQITCNTWGDTESFTAFAAAQTGATAAANTWLTNALTNWIAPGHRGWPWVVGDSGWTAMTAYDLETGTTHNI
jgi:hypothetical protein